MTEASALTAKLCSWLAGGAEKGEEAEGELLEEMAYEAYYTTRAVEGNGAMQGAFCRAADYSDEWFNKGARLPLLLHMHGQAARGRAVRPRHPVHRLGQSAD